MTEKQNHFKFHDGKPIGAVIYAKDNITEKRFTKCDTIIRDNGEEMSQAEVRDMLNALHEENERLRNQLSHIQYRFFEYKNKRKIITEKEVKKTLQKYFNRYTQMALELRHDKYGNGVCHDVTEILMEIADDLGVKLE